MTYKKFHTGLRAELIRRKYSNTDILTKPTGKSIGYVKKRMAGSMVWDLKDVYQICDWLGEPRERIPELFDI